VQQKTSEQGIGGLHLRLLPPSSRWVELSPLAALGDVIVRDSSGNMLARFSCHLPLAVLYIDFRAGSGEYLTVRRVETWG